MEKKARQKVINEYKKEKGHCNSSENHRNDKNYLESFLVLIFKGL